MDNPAVKRTIINVKNVDAEQWERAKTAANRADETLGEWITRAVRHLADLEEGGVIPPGKQANPRQAMTPEQLTGLMQGLAALQVAAGKPVPSRSAAALRAVAEDLALAARGLPPRVVKTSPGRGPVLGDDRLIGNGKSEG